MARAHIKNWATFQHYKDRSPPWLKLHRGLLDDFSYQRLPVASRALAPMIWLLASESEDGSVEADAEWLAFRLRCPVSEVSDGLGPLIDKGFLILDSAALADRLQGATPERETEAERETEGEGDSAPASKGRKRSAEQGIADWTASLGDEVAIPSDDPVFAYADKISLPREFLALAWSEFEARSLESGKKYKDWRSAFRKCVRENWYRLWWEKDGAYSLTTAGIQAQRAAA